MSSLASSNILSTESLLLVETTKQKNVEIRHKLIENVTENLSI